MKRNESREDYLETILLLSQKLQHVRSIDVANEMGFKKSSVSVAMKHLRESNLIHVGEAGYIDLLPEGKKLAETVYAKHTILAHSLMKLGVSEEIALKDACRIEHDLSDESFEAIKKYFKE